METKNDRHCHVCDEINGHTKTCPRYEPPSEEDDGFFMLPPNPEAAIPLKWGTKADNSRAALVKEYMRVAGVAAHTRLQLDLLLESSPIHKVLLSDLSLEHLLDRLVVVYRHYSDETLQDLVAFYNTHAGRKLVELIPTITRESHGIGQRVADEAMARFKALPDWEARVDAALASS